MAIFPCDVCRKRYAGRSNSAYIGWMAGGFSDRRKYNLCQNHAEELEAKLQKHMALIEVGGVMQTDNTEIAGTCEVCGLEPTQQTWFANTYYRTKDNAVWVRGVCQKCALPLSQELVLGV